MAPSGTPGCLDEDAVLEFVNGSLDADTLGRVEQHLAHCRDCSWLVTAAVLVREEDAPMAPRADARSLLDSTGRRFEQLELIAEGAMGSVYRALDAQTGATVALKRLKRALAASNPELIERFLRESEILRRLDHPNIVKIIASIDGPEGHQIAMEYMPGGSLRSLLQAQQRLAPRCAIQLLLELTDALARAHHLGVTHRDIKPENVLLAADGTPRLSDFGLSRLADQELSQAQLLVGTLPYLSPEALAGGPLDARVDLWAIGVMLFEMLAGQRPFRGSSPAALMRSILQQAVPDLRALCPEAPPALLEISQRLLERQPEQRIDSARQLGALLEAAYKQSLAPESAVSGVALQTGAESAPRPLELASLPRAMTPFIGREREVASVLRLLRDPNVQLVTLTGPGGMGKSRVALEVARRLGLAIGAGQGSPRVCFVDLTRISDPQQIVSAIGSALGFAFPTGAGDASAQLCAYLREKELLLLLDNFEHVLPAAGFIARLLEGAPAVQVLATSREPLRLAGETQFALSGMELDVSAEAGAVELFVSSARRVRADFDPQLDMPAVLEICRALHGMPLGIVLASSWVAVLGPGEIAAEIGRNPDFLRDQRGDLPSRQRSLRAVFDHSWALLTPEERGIFARLSAFRGGFTRAAAEAVADAKLAHLATLVAKSLVGWQPSASRYVIHELLRQYAEEKLAELPDRQLTEERMGAYFSQFLAEREPVLQKLRQRRVMHEVAAELGNIGAAWQGLLERREVARVAPALWALCVYHRRRGSRADVERACAEVAQAFFPEGLPAGQRPSAEWRRLAGMALAMQALHGKDQGKRAQAIALMTRALAALEDVGECRERALAWIVAGWVMNEVWSAERCIDSAERGLRFYREWGCNWPLAEALAFTAQVHLETKGDPLVAEALLRENLEIQRRLNDGYIAMPTSLCLLGLVRGRMGDWREGCELILQALELGEQLNDVWAIEGALRLAARAKVNLGEFEAAAGYARRCMKLCRETGALESVAWCKFTLAEIAKQWGELEESAGLYREALALSPPDTPQLANAMLNLGDIALLRGRYHDAQRHFQESLAAFEARRVDWGVINALESLGHLACQEQRRREAAQHFERALALSHAARRWPLVANAIVGLARVHAEQGDTERAIELLGWASANPALHFQTWTRHVDPLLRQLGARLPERIRDAAHARGRELSLDAALQSARTAVQLPHELAARAS
ncbi:MAG TPA: protein kinase [Polyangiaceae bacterium]|jgi:predicted ATPase/tRNA A-37 threonylcarbamoyl transferase component Bud32|nr:protein kinase [Polyangiaceae bacterium]